MGCNLINAISLQGIPAVDPKPLLRGMGCNLTNAISRQGSPLWIPSGGMGYNLRNAISLQGSLRWISQSGRCGPGHLHIYQSGTAPNFKKLPKVVVNSLGEHVKELTILLGARLPLRMLTVWESAITSTSPPIIIIVGVLGTNARSLLKVRQRRRCCCTRCIKDIRRLAIILCTYQ